MSQINVKGHLKLSLIYSAVAAVPPVLQVLVQPFIEGSDRLNAIDFAQIGMAEMITSFAFVFTLFAMGNAISRFFYDVEDDRKAYNSLVSGTFSSILVRGIFLVLVAFAFRNYIGELFTQERLSNFSTYGFAAIITGINRSINISAATLYRNEKRVQAFITVNIATAVLRTAFQLIGLFYFEMSFLGFVYGSAIGSSIVSLGVLFYSYRQCGFRYDKVLMKQMNVYAWPLFQYGILAWALTFADKYFMERFPSDLGIYFTAVNFALGMQIIMQGIQGATQPEIFRFMKQGIQKRQAEISSLSNMLMAQTQVMVALFILPVMLYLTIFYETDIRFASTFIALIFIRYLPRTQYVIFSFVLYYEKKTRFFFYLNLVTLTLNIVLNLILIPRLFVYGAIIALMTADVVQMLGAYFYSQRVAPIRWNLTKLLYSPLICVAIIISLEIIKQVFSLNQYITASLSVIVLFASLLMLYRNDIYKFLKIR